MAEKKKKRNWLVVVGVTAGVLVALLLLGRVTNMLKIYRIPTISNEPSIQKGSIIYTSNLQPIARGRHITFLTYDSLQQGIATWLHRCVGVPGDELQMKNGVLLVNGKDADKDRNLMQEYILTTQNVASYQALQDLTEEELYSAGQPDNNFAGMDNYHLFLTSKQLHELQSQLVKGDSLKRFIEGAYSYYTYFSKTGHPEWTVDNFGPLKVPADSYFVLGDNRHQAQDSRFIGFIEKEKVTGVVVR